MKEGIGMLFKKKTLDEKMEKYVKHHDWYAIQEVITGSKEEKIAAAKALGASDDQTSVDLLLRFIDDTDDDVVFAACESLRKVGSEHDSPACNSNELPSPSVTVHVPSMQI